MPRKLFPPVAASEVATQGFVVASLPIVLAALVVAIAGAPVQTAARSHSQTRNRPREQRGRHDRRWPRSHRRPAPPVRAEVINGDFQGDSPEVSLATGAAGTAGVIHAATSSR